MSQPRRLPTTEPLSAAPASQLYAFVLPCARDCETYWQRAGRGAAAAPACLLPKPAANQNGNSKRAGESISKQLRATGNRQRAAANIALQNWLSNNANFQFNNAASLPTCQTAQPALECRGPAAASLCCQATNCTFSAWCPVDTSAVMPTRRTTLRHE